MILTPDGVRTEAHELNASTWLVSWAPDSAGFLALTPEGAVTLAADGSERELLAPNATGGDWCADGRVVVEQYGELRVVEPDRSPRRLTWRGGSEPSCAPDGSRVAFTRGDALWVVELAGGRARKLTDRGFAPAWSPDGRQIAFLRRLGNPRRATVTHLYRLGLRRLRARRVSIHVLEVDDSYSDEAVDGPAWRPL